MNSRLLGTADRKMYYQQKYQLSKNGRSRVRLDVAVDVEDLRAQANASMPASYIANYIY